jgi:hypothetical protein
MRYFEAIGAGAVLLTDPARNNGVEELFTVGGHYLEYFDEQAMLSQIRELLNDPERCRQIAESARRHVLELHTYRNRANSLLKLVRLSQKLSQPQPEDSISVFLSLNLFDAALTNVGRAMALSQCGAFSKHMWRVTAFFLNRLAGVLDWLDRCRVIFQRP